MGSWDNGWDKCVPILKMNNYCSRHTAVSVHETMDIRKINKLKFFLPIYLLLADVNFLNSQIASYYMKDRQTPIKRFKDIKIELPNKVAFQKKDDGFVAYITLKGAKKILTLDFTDGKEPTIG